MSGKFRVQRWFVRLLFGMAPTIAATSVLIVFVVGFLLGMAFVAQPSRMGFIVRDVMEKSSWADWITALATTVVGYMAWRISKDNLDHQVRVKSEQDQAVALDHLSEMNALLDNIFTCGGVAKRIQDYETEGLTHAELHQRVSIALTVLRSPEWSRKVLSLLEGPTSESYYKLKFSLMALVDIAVRAEAIVLTMPQEDALTPQAVGWIDNMRERANSVVRDIDEFLPLFKPSHTRMKLRAGVTQV